jgi:WD40 repeat protein
MDTPKHRSFSNEFNYSNHLGETPKYNDAEIISFDLENIKKLNQESYRLPSLSGILNSSKQSNISQEISEISNTISELLPKTKTYTYKFTDAKMLSDEIHIVCVTADGICAHINLNTYKNQQIVLSNTTLSCIITCSNDSLAFAKEKDFGVIYCIGLQNFCLMKKLNIKEHSGIGRMCVNPTETFLYARLWTGKIIRWSIKQLDDYQVILKDKKIISFNVSPDSALVVGTKDNRLVLYSSHFVKISERSFNFQINAFINFSKSGDLIILCFSSSIKIVAKDSLSLINEIELKSQPLTSTVLEPQMYLIIGLESGDVNFYDLHSPKSLKIRLQKSSISYLYITMSQDYIYTFGINSDIIKIKFPRLNMFKSSKTGLPFNSVLMASVADQDKSLEFKKKKRLNNPKSFKPLCMTQSESMDLIIVGGESKNISLWDRGTMKKYGDLVGHAGFIHSLASLDNNIVASGSEDTNIIIWNYRLLKKISSLSSHTSTVSAVIKIDEFRLASGSWDKTVKIWAWEDQTILFSITDFPDKILALCIPKYNKLFIGMKNSIHCWDLKSYCVVFDKDCERELSCFRVFLNPDVPDKVYIGLSMEEDGWWIENPFFGSEIEFWGKNEGEVYEYIRYLNAIIKKYPQIYDQNMDRFNVFPYNINTLHFYAYYNLPDHLYLGIINGAPILESSSVASPMSIALDMDNIDCVQAIIKGAREIYYKNPYFLSNISIGMLKVLNKIQNPVVSKLSKLLLIKYPKKIKVNFKIPTISTSNSSILSKKLENSKKNSTESSYFKSVVSFYVEPGSERSLKYLYSLMECEDDKLFESKLIKSFILLKWRQVRKLGYIELGVFILYYANLVFRVFGNQISFIGIYVLGLLLFLNNIGYTVKFFRYWAVYYGLVGVLLNLYAAGRVLGFETKVIVFFLYTLETAQGILYFPLFKKLSVVLETFKTVLLDLSGLFMIIFYAFLAACLTINAWNEVLYIHEPTIVSQLIILGCILIVVLCFAPKTTKQTKNLRKKVLKNLVRFIIKAEFLMLWNRGKKNKHFLEIFKQSKPKIKPKLINCTKILNQMILTQTLQKEQTVNSINQATSLITEINTDLSNLKGLKKLKKLKKIKNKL